MRENPTFGYANHPPETISMIAGVRKNDYIYNHTMMKEGREISFNFFIIIGLIVSRSGCFILSHSTFQ